MFKRFMAKRNIIKKIKANEIDLLAMIKNTIHLVKYPSISEGDSVFLTYTISGDIGGDVSLIIDADITNTDDIKIIKYKVH